jgi:hypothetical protein
MPGAITSAAAIDMAAIDRAATDMAATDVTAREPSKLTGVGGMSTFLMTLLREVSFVSASFQTAPRDFERAFFLRLRL